MLCQVRYSAILFAVLFLQPIEMSAAPATVDFSKTKQIIDGFGGSSAWCPAYNAITADALFGNGANQLGLTILRLRIDPGNNWATEKTNATMAKARGATVFATPWSPPTSMKTNGKTVNGGIITSKFADFTAWMKTFWTYCGEGNVDIMSIENEPDNAEQISYEGCTWTAQNFLDFCKTYAPQIGKPIMMPESFGFNFALSDQTLYDSTASKNVSYIGGHLYGSGPKKYTKALDLKKHVWETEHYYTDDGVSQCMSTAKEIFDCMNCDFSAYVWWRMTYSSSEGLYYGGSTQHRGWVLAQFSKWVRPGYVRVEATYNPQSGVYVVAFKGTQYVVVAMNNSSSAQSVTFSFSNASFSSVDKFTSSQTKNGASEGAITVKNNSFTSSLDAQSVSTFVGGAVNVLPMESDDRWYTVETPYRAATPANAAARFMYLINGKRCRVPGMNEERTLAPGMYVIPENVPLSKSVGKPVHNAGQYPGEKGFGPH